MLTELCKYLNNWFDKDRWFGTFKIEDGQLVDAGLQEGQYFRIVGSVFNDGVHQYGEFLQDETFDGAVWAMAVPPTVVALAAEIEDWQGKYGGVDSANMSPYTSESFGGYSYSKSSGSSSGGTSPDLSGTWEGAFAARLNPWKKVHPW